MENKKTQRKDLIVRKKAIPAASPTATKIFSTGKTSMPMDILINQ
jgi:hypothetical protein